MVSKLLADDNEVGGSKGVEIKLLGVCWIPFGALLISPRGEEYITGNSDDMLLADVSCNATDDCSAAIIGSKFDFVIDVETWLFIVENATDAGCDSMVFDWQ